MYVSTASMQHRQIRRYPLVLCLLLLAGAVAPTGVYSFPLRLKPWKQPAGQNQTTDRRRRLPGLSELFGANENDWSDAVDADSKMVKNGRTGPAPGSSFEEMIRKMTNNPEYKVRLSLEVNSSRGAVSCLPFIVHQSYLRKNSLL